MSIYAPQYYEAGAELLSPQSLLSPRTRERKKLTEAVSDHLLKDDEPSHYELM